MSLAQNIADAVAGAIKEAEQREQARYLTEESTLVAARKAVADEFAGIGERLSGLDVPLAGSRERLKGLVGQFEHLSSVQGFWGETPVSEQLQGKGRVLLLAGVLIGLAILQRASRG